MATLKNWYPLTRDNLDHSGNDNHLTLVNGNGGLVRTLGPLGECLSQPSVAKTGLAENNGCGLTGSHAMFCFLRVNAPDNTTTANGVLGCHGHSSQTGTGITLHPHSSTQYSVSVNTGWGTGRTFNAYYTGKRLDVGKWYHVGFTWDQEERILRIYVDGKVEYELLTHPLMVMLPNAKLQLFTWSVEYTSTNYRPAMDMQDVRIYEGVPGLSTIQHVSRGLFFHAPMDQPTPGSLMNVTSWNVHSPYSTRLEYSKTRVIVKVVRNGTIAITPSQGLISGKKYRVSGYCLKNGNPVSVSRVTTYSNSYIDKSEPSTGWFSCEFEATGTWAIHQADGLGSPVVGDVYEFFDMAVENLADETGINETVTDASGFGNDLVTNIDAPMFDPQETAKGRGSLFFNSNILISKNNVVRHGDEITVLIWIKTTTTGKDGYHIPLTCNGSKTEISFGSSFLRVGVNVSGARKAFNSDVDYKDGNWHLVGLVYSEGSLKAYFDGNVVGTLSAPGALDPLNGPLVVGQFEPKVNSTYGSVNMNQTDLYLFGRGLEESDVRALYEERLSVNKAGEFKSSGIDDTELSTSLTRQGLLKTSNLLESNFKPTLVDYSRWVVGNRGAPTFGVNGATSENIIVTDEAPHGFTDVMWEASNTDTKSDADGGWNGDFFPIDRTKTYRLSLWLRRKVTGNGTGYFGINAETTTPGYGIQTMAGSQNANPYFYNGSISNEWRLYVAYVFAHGTSGTPDLGQGIYDTDGNKVSGITTFKFSDGASRLRLRAYLYYSTNPATIQHFYRPRVEEMDGTEPSIAELVNCAEHTPLLNRYSNNAFVSDPYVFGNHVVASDFSEFK